MSKIKIMENKKSGYYTSSILLIIFIGVLFITSISIIAIQTFIDDWFAKRTVKIIMLTLSILRNISYILPVLAIRDRKLKVAGIVAASILILCLLISPVITLFNIQTF